MGWSKFKSYLINHHGRYLDRAVAISDLRFLLGSLRPRHYGFTPIRLGGEYDGGYVVPNIVSKCDSCFSAGVADSIAFELDLFRVYGVASHLADYSVDQPENMPSEFTFDKRFLGSFASESTMTFDEWSNKFSGQSNEMLVQMDIEGSEYEVLLNISERALSRISVLVVEFHGLERLMSRAFWPIGKAVFDRLEKYFNVFHIHPNNVGSCVRLSDGVGIPSLMEITFVSKRLCHLKSEDEIPELPLDIDSPNRACRPNLIVDADWKIRSS